MISVGEGYEVLRRALGSKKPSASFKAMRRASGCRAPDDGEVGWLKWGVLGKGITISVSTRC